MGILVYAIHLEENPRMADNLNRRQRHRLCSDQAIKRNPLLRTFGFQSFDYVTYLTLSQSLRNLPLTAITERRSGGGGNVLHFLGG